MKIRSTMVYMALASPAVVWLIGALTACNLGGSAIAEDVTTFEGHYVSGFEVSSFVPCGMAARPGYGKGHWLEPSTDFSKQYRQFIAATPDPTPDHGFEPVIVHVRFEGELAPMRPWFSGYGHLGAYDRAVTVKKLLEMRLSADHDCRK